MQIRRRATENQFHFTLNQDNRSGFRAPNQIVIEASAGRDRFVRNGKGPVGKVRLSPYNEEDLDLELEYGLKTMQAGRIARMIEQADTQDALLSMRRLTCLTNSRRPR